MNEQEANKVIAEYMGETLQGDYRVSGRVGTSIDPSAVYLSEPYYKSLDALVPVWERLEDMTGSGHDSYFKRWSDGDWLFDFGETEKAHSFSASLQQAACIATAKAIKELEGRDG